jgi:Rieske Fe-S protein
MILPAPASPCPDPGRRAFCCQACAAAALALLGPALLAQAAPAAPAAPAAEDTRWTTGETRAGMPAGTVKDYRKQAGFFLAADAAGIYALTAICTHNGCKVRLEGGGGFHCPCHDSEYDLHGTVTQGPAKLPLKHFQVAEATPGGPLVVDLGQVVDPHVRL